MRPEERKQLLYVFLVGDACCNVCAVCNEREVQWLELTVSDTGPGIAPDQAERIFQPFFTTKAHGIGLGLAITRRLVEDHGGYIRVGGQFGYGATISVRLPLVTWHDEMEKREVSKMMSLAILIIDDEPHLPHQLARFLRKHYV